MATIEGPAPPFPDKPATQKDNTLKPAPTKSAPPPSQGSSGMGEYSGQNVRALIWASVYFLGWILQRLWCHLGFPDYCDVATRPLDVLTDLVVLFTFALAQAWWCELLEKNRWEDTMKAPWIFGVILVTPMLISALGLIKGLRPWTETNPGEDFEWSSVRSTIFIFGLIATVFFIAWHFARAFLTLEGTILMSGGGKSEVKKPEENLHGIYSSSRTILVIWAILFVSFLIVDDQGFDFRGPLVAWVLSLLAVFPIPISLLWLGVTTGIFIQGIGANRLRFLGCSDS